MLYNYTRVYIYIYIYICNVRIVFSIIQCKIVRKNEFNSNVFITNYTDSYSLRTFNVKYETFAPL